MNSSSAEVSLELRSLDDVRRFWLRAREVPRRTAGRTKKQYERYYAALYLLALADHQALSYPLKLLEWERPDFILTWKSDETIGLEVTRVTEKEVQRWITRAEREHPKGPAMMASPYGYRGDQIEEEWCVLVREAIEKKVAMLPGYMAVSRCDLLVSDDTRMGAGNRRTVLSFLSSCARELKQREPRLGKISVVASLDVLYDVGGESRIFPYIEWSAPNLEKAPEGVSFSDRVEYAGQVVAEKAIQAHKAAGSPIYFIDSKERLVKETPDGRRFEVRVNERGEESTIQELSRR